MFAVDMVKLEQNMETGRTMREGLPRKGECGLKLVQFSA